MMKELPDYGFPALAANPPSIFDIYKQYCVFFMSRVSEEQRGTIRLESREALGYLQDCFESRARVGNTVDDEISLLMSSLHSMGDECRDFSLFYNFVFFISLENGHKCICVSRAVTNWRIVLAGRFRLLNQWCDFVEKNQRHNISEDTWRQVLTFCNFCADGSIQRYDPEGFWPVLIDDFMEHLSSIHKNPYSKAISLNDNGNVNTFNDSRLENSRGIKRDRCEDFASNGLEPSYHEFNKRRHCDEI